MLVLRFPQTEEAAFRTKRFGSFRVLSDLQTFFGLNELRLSSRNQNEKVTSAVADYWSLISPLTNITH